MAFEPVASAASGSRLRTAATACRLHPTFWIATSPWPHPTKYGSATLPPSRPMRDGYFWLWSWIYSAARWWAGLDMAWLKRSPDSKAGGKTELIFHSDRGSQYASYDFTGCSKSAELRPR